MNFVDPLNITGQRFGIDATKVTITNDEGAEIDCVEVIRDNDKLFIVDCPDVLV